MRPQESLEERLQMVDMHDDVLYRIETAIRRKQSIEACWLCYACFESRITRTLEKVSESCQERKCYHNNKVGIATRIDCIKRLKRQCYAGTEHFDIHLLGGIKAWCNDRNKLVHALVTLNNYYGMDKKFLELAKRGKPLVDSLYTQTTAFRNAYYELSEMPPFPEMVHEKCRLLKEKTKE